jgi:hypothetical protein
MPARPKAQIRHLHAGLLQPDTPVRQVECGEVQALLQAKEDICLHLALLVHHHIVVAPAVRVGCPPVLEERARKNRPEQHVYSLLVYFIC